MREQTNPLSRHTSLTPILIAAVLTTLFVPAPPARAQGGPIVNEVAKLFASDGVSGDEFGQSVAISGDTAVVGAIADDNSGSAYVFTRDANGAWTQQAKLIASDGAVNDNANFGQSVAISGDTAVVGAFRDADNGPFTGSAYVFVRDGAGVWTQQTKLLAADTTAGDQLGFAVALSGDTAVVGVIGDDDNGADSGSAYVFVRDASGVWTQQAKLLASDGAAGDALGSSIALIGDSAVIGATGDGDNGPGSGSAYVFVRDANGVWTQQAKLLANDGAAGDSFGSSAGLSGDTAVIGAWFDDDACAGDVNCNSGSAYAFTRDANGVWFQQAKLLANDGAAGDQFGISVAINGDIAVVGANGDQDNGAPFSGSAYVFVRDASGAWTQQDKLLASDGAPFDGLGGSAAIGGDTAIVGAIFGSGAGNVIEPGSAYVFELPAQGSPADLNGDGVVDGADLATLLTQWGTNGSADLNGDGTVDGADLAQLLTNWGPV